MAALWGTADTGDVRARRRLLYVATFLLAVGGVAWSVLAPTKWSYWLSLIPLAPAIILYGGWAEDDFPTYSRRVRRLIWMTAIVLAVTGSLLYLFVRNNHIYVAGGWLAFPLLILLANAFRDAPSGGSGGMSDGPWGLP